MEEAVRVKNTGLRGITVADTKISYIDGEQGILIYRGYRIEELAERSSFMEVAYLLLHGTLPGRSELEAFEAEVLAARDIPDFLLESYRHWRKDADPMDVLQASIPLLATVDQDLKATTKEANLRMAVRLIARMPALVAAWHRIRSGQDPLPPDNSLSHAANFLWQLHGVKPDPEIAKDLDVCLVLHADHTFNASTFACREVVSTLAHMYAGVSAGIGALSGSLHGGANARVMKMLFDVVPWVESGKTVTDWVAGKLARGEKIMGMGHAVYKTFDPRSTILKKMSERLGRKLSQPHWFEWLTTIETAALQEFEKRGKTSIKSNVDFYSGSVYHMMGIPVDLMTPIFAISRISGWCSHIIEEKFAEAQGKPALYRPEAEYVGDYCGAMGCVYKPLEVRA
ncbi:MAG: citrate synthase [Syntrophobacteraceae bacterium]